MRVGRDPYLEGLKGEHGEDFLHAADHLDRMLVAMQSAIDAGVPERARVESALKRAYKGIRLTENPFQQIRQAILNFLSEQIARALFYLTSNRGIGSLVAWTVVVFVLIAVTVLVVRRIRLVPDKALPSTETERSARFDWEAEAEAALARGDHPGAVRARYRALLQALAYRGAIRDEPSLTAGEARGATSKALPSAYPAVAGATAVFERVAYGREPLAPGELDEMKRAETVVKTG